MKQVKTQQTLYNPSQSAEPISDEHAPHLENIINGGLLRTVTPDHIESDFIQRGLIYKATGGLMPTIAGQHAFMNWQKENNK